MMMNFTLNKLKSTNFWKIFPFNISVRILALILILLSHTAIAQTSFTSTALSTAWNAARWNNTSDAAPYTSTFTANNAVSFTSGTYNIAGMGADINVGNITVASGVTVNFTASSNNFATNASVRTINIGSGGLLDFNGQTILNDAGTGFIKNGAGVLGTGSGTYKGGFTLNAGTVVARGVNAFGALGTNSLALNGGTIASNASVSLRVQDFQVE